MPKFRDIAFVWASLWLMGSCLGVLSAIGADDGWRSIRLAAWAGVMLLALGVMLMSWCAGRVVDCCDRLEAQARTPARPPVATQRHESSRQNPPPLSVV